MLKSLRAIKVSKCVVSGSGFKASTSGLKSHDNSRRPAVEEKA